MRIFVTYSYRSDDSWIEDLVFELIRASKMNRYGKLAGCCAGRGVEEHVLREAAEPDGSVCSPDATVPLAGTMRTIKQSTLNRSGTL
jgi:hypothetical protein